MDVGGVGAAVAKARRGCVVKIGVGLALRVRGGSVILSCDRGHYGCGDDESGYAHEYVTEVGLVWW